MVLKKHLALNNKFIPLNQKLVANYGPISGKGVAPRRLIVNEAADLMGGLLISDKAGNIFKGGKINRIPQRKPIRFLV